MSDPSKPGQAEALTELIHSLMEDADNYAQTAVEMADRWRARPERECLEENLRDALTADRAQPSEGSAARCHWPDCPHGADCVHAQPSAEAGEAVPALTDDRIADWADNFIRKEAYHRPTAVAIAMEAAKFVRAALARPAEQDTARDAARYRLALENCRLLAARWRNHPGWEHILRFCADAGVTGSPLRSPGACTWPRCECGDLGDCPPGGAAMGSDPLEIGK